MIVPNENDVSVKIIPEDHVQFFCATCHNAYRVDTVKTRNKVTSFVLTCVECNKQPDIFTRAVYIKMYHTLPENLKAISRDIK